MMMRKLELLNVTIGRERLEEIAAILDELESELQREHAAHEAEYDGPNPYEQLWGHTQLAADAAHNLLKHSK
jgi:hypothetical protein